MTTLRKSLLVIVACGLIACGSRPDVEVNNPTKVAVDAPPAPAGDSGAPKWVSADCVTYFRGLGQQVLCGVGAVKGMSDPNLARTAAQGRGRTEMARTIQVEVSSVLNDYQSQGVDERGVLQGEGRIESISKQVSNVTLSGTRMVESYRAPDGAFYVLMVLDEGDFRTAIAAAPNMEQPVRDVVLSCAPKLFSAYDDETSAY